ncbi:DUF1275 domain-containing protein [Gemmata sp. G18]|uniref:DUF1275 domain-containing protein n=1 Tax=Gemmata palustris TaxID=2822762 RepID=A0ABS5BV82_9BACT|nr:YoaK family protein [Gemmata palustris]MBP3957593.1 DUF1275 domain-containing protein [Gemmata palustris]
MPYVLHTPDTIFSARHTPSWLLLAGASGMVNGLAFLACEQYVTHVTGTATRLGLEWPHAGIALEYAVVVLSFIFGAMASVLALQARVTQGKPPRWATPLVIVALTLTGVALAGLTGVFGPFGGAITTEPPFVLLSLLAFASGLQNAAVATSTGLAVRTTHLTGPATDLGIHLGVAYFTKGEDRRAALRGALLRGGKVFAFVAGAGLALPLAGATGYLAFFVPAVGVLIAAGLSFIPAWGPSDFPDREESAQADPPPAAEPVMAGAQSVR